MMMISLRMRIANPARGQLFLPQIILIVHHDEDSDDDVDHNDDIDFKVDVDEDEDFDD